MSDLVGNPKDMFSRNEAQVLGEHSIYRVTGSLAGFVFQGVTAQLICAIVLSYAKSRLSPEATRMLWVYIRIAFRHILL